MSVRLERSDGTSLKVNAWNWGTLHAVVDALDVLPLETWVGARTGGGAYLTPDEVAILARTLRERVLFVLRPGERLGVGGAITSEPDDGAFHRDDLAKNYSLDHDVLAAIITFLEGATGIVTIY